MPIFRPAHENDLIQVHNVFYQNEVRRVQSPPPPAVWQRCLIVGSISPT